MTSFKVCRLSTDSDCGKSLLQTLFAISLARAQYNTKKRVYSNNLHDF